MNLSRWIPARSGWICLPLLLTMASPVSAQNFYHTDGTRIVAPDGYPDMMRGIGLGGWLVPEGYMLHVPGHWGPTQINDAVEDLIGEQYAEAFWQLYREHHVARIDVEAIASWGFDHIRLPMHYNLLWDDASSTFKEEGFATLDSLAVWCREAGLGLVLDMHAAPGAQSDGPIADSDGEARLWTEPEPHQTNLITIWREIARRFADRQEIIGYDLINEPVIPNSVDNHPVVLRDLYERITDAVREEDPNHIVFIEGNYFATTFDNLTPPFDDNLVYSFHKYWNPPSIGTIQYLLDIRDTYNVPLWLGETGENSNPWLYETVKLSESEAIPWNFWTHKKIRTTTAPLSTPILEGYQRVVDYWHGAGPRPSQAEAREALYGQARALALDSARVNPGVLPALLDPSFGSLREPVVNHVIPGIVNAVDYDLGNRGVTYSDREFWATSGSPGGGNSGTYLRNDGVDIELSSDPQGHAYNVGWLEPLEWMEYTVDVTTTGQYSADVRVASLSAGGNLSISMNGQTLGSLVAAFTGGWQQWVTQTIGPFDLTAGRHVLRVSIGRAGGFNLNRLTFNLLQATSVDEKPGQELPRMDVYPNPASDQLSVIVSYPKGGPYDWTLEDVTGRQVRRESVHLGTDHHRFSLGVGDLAPGVYVLRMRPTGDAVATGSPIPHRLVVVTR